MIPFPGIVCNKKCYGLVRAELGGAWQGGIFDISDPACVSSHGFYLDRANSVNLELDTCSLRFLPAYLGHGADKEIKSPKVLFAFPNTDADIILSHDTCSGELRGHPSI